MPRTMPGPTPSWVLLSLALAALVLGGRPSPARAAVDPHSSYAPPAPRAAQVVTPAAAARLAAEGTSVLWVTFTDKGETDARSFASAVRSMGKPLPANAPAPSGETSARVRAFPCGDIALPGR